MQLRLIPPGFKYQVCDLFKGLIGVLHWICKFGRMDTSVDVAMLLRFLVAPRRGPLDRASFIFAYLKWYNWSSVVIDEPKSSLTFFWLCDWIENYSGVCNAAVSPDAPDVRSDWF